MGRFQELRGIFERNRCFKLVCGAGNEDAGEVRKLAIIYTLAGAVMFDVSANAEIVRAAREGVESAMRLAPVLGRVITTRPFINVSIGIEGDPHVRKAGIDACACTACGECLKACAQKAITIDFAVIEKRCIGCGDCGRACLFGAVSYEHRRKNIEEVLPECIKEGAETMELHAATADDEAVFKDWGILSRLVSDNFLSICLDRSQLSDAMLIDRVRRAREVVGDRLIVQADGVPMSGGKDDFNTTLQAVACSDIIRKSGVPVVMLLSGGTNSKTGLLARQCGVAANGVAVGSWARRLVRAFITRDDIDSDPHALFEAVAVAGKLVRANLEALNGRHED